MGVKDGQVSDRSKRRECHRWAKAVKLLKVVFGELKLRIGAKPFPVCGSAAVMYEIEAQPSPLAAVPQ